MTAGAFPESPNFIPGEIFLVDRLRNAKVKAPRRDFVGIHNVSIHRVNRSAIFQHPPSRIEFRPILLGKNPRLQFACGIKQKVLPKINHAILFDISLKTGWGRAVPIFHRELAPEHVEEGGWLECEVDLTRFENREVRLIFSTSVPKDMGTEYCWSVWGDPRILHESRSSKGRLVHPTPAHVFLITSDALRYDYLGGYGNTVVRTPNCDRLAEEGVLFEHARVQTVSTLGSHATMLLSRSPLRHKITTEWGRIPDGLPSLPKYLHSHGYRTVVAPSEMELMDPRAGIVPLFDECIPCRGNPSQDGSITVRLALEAIERRTHPSFFWLHFFDTHPPVTPPEPFRSMYYSGNPAAETKRYRPEAVAAIKGTETLLEFSIALPLLKRGVFDALFIAKLEATAEAFRGGYACDPDLAIHLRNLGPRAYRDLSRTRFAAWLDEQVARLKNGVVPESLLGWMDDVFPLLQEINDDIVTWLSGVVDLRYPLSQYAGAVSYLDSHLGTLFSYLRENELFEKSTIILTSPHGEILDEFGISFHHHTLTESCLRVPLIIKPSQHIQMFPPAARVGGMFNSLDLFPTIIEMLGLPLPDGVEGRSRSSHIYSSVPIPDQDSFSVNNSNSMYSVANGNFKFMRVEKDHALSKEKIWRAGERMLFDLRASPADTINLVDEMPELAREMERRLDAWLRNSGSQ